MSPFLARLPTGSASASILAAHHEGPAKCFAVVCNGFRSTGKAQHDFSIPATAPSRCPAAFFSDSATGGHEAPTLSPANLVLGFHVVIVGLLHTARFSLT